MRYLTIFAADMHLKPGAQPAQNAAVARFLDEVARRGARRLILLGDIFNFWFERAGKPLGDYCEIFALFSAAAANGLTIDLVSGNRDFMFGSSARDAAFYRGFFRGRAGANDESCLVGAAGVNPRGFDCRFRQDGELIHCCHGDRYAISEPGHGMMRWWTMSLPMRFFWAYAPTPILRIFFAPLQQRPTVPYRKLFPHTRLLEPEVLAPFAAQGVTHFFCGHFHSEYREFRVGAGGAEMRAHI